MEEISFAKVFTVPYRWLAAYLLLLVDKNQMIPVSAEHFSNYIGLLIPLLAMVMIIGTILTDIARWEKMVFGKTRT